MKKETVYVLELDGLKSIHLTLECLRDAMEREFDLLHPDDFEDIVFKVYASEMTQKEIDDLPEFEGF